MIPFRHHVSDCRNEDYYYVADDRVTLPKASAEVAPAKEKQQKKPIKYVLNLGYRDPANFLTEPRAEEPPGNSEGW
jgi:hypothetical protein